MRLYDWKCEFTNCSYKMNDRNLSFDTSLFWLIGSASAKTKAKTGQNLKIWSQAVWNRGLLTEVFGGWQVNAIHTLSNLIAELSLHNMWHSACCTWEAPDVMHTIALRPFERACWRQFKAQWGCYQSWIAPFSTFIIIVIVIIVIVIIITTSTETDYASQ